MYNGVIVKFSQGKFSLKTKTKCWWCRGRYWSSEDDVRAFEENLHPKVIDTNEFPMGLGMNKEIQKMLSEQCN